MDLGLVIFTAVLECATASGVIVTLSIPTRTAMKIELIRNARPHGVWFFGFQLADDIISRRLELQPGDKLFVTAGEPPKLSVVRDSAHLTLVAAE